MRNWGGRIVSLAVILVVTQGCVSTERFSAASHEIENQDQVIEKLEIDRKQLQEENAKLRGLNEMAELELARLRKKSDTTAELVSLREQLAALREKYEGLGDLVQVGQRPDGISLTVAGQVLFALGSEKISPGGQDVLQQIAAKINESDNNIRVEGHTDNSPLRRVKSLYPRGNLQLSGARSLNVADYLVKTCGVERARVSFAGFGAQQPVAANDTDGNRAQNRRVEIVILNHK